MQSMSFKEDEEGNTGGGGGKEESTFAWFCEGDKICLTEIEENLK